MRQSRSFPPLRTLRPGALLVLLLLRANLLPGQVYTFSQHKVPYQPLQNPALTNYIDSLHFF
ncbi:MAG TPA: hypothetical protein VF646_11350, partial [Cytophagales bacterium]